MTDAEREPSDEPGPARRWLGWAFVALGAAGGLWLASLPLDRMVPEPRERRALLPDAPADPPETTTPGAAPAPAPAEPAAPPSPSAPVPEVEAIDPPATTPSAEWVAEDPGAPLEDEPAGAEALRARLERQLQMNDLGEVRIEIVGDRVVTSGRLLRPSDRQRVALLIRSLAPDLVHEDHAQDAGAH